MMNLVSEISVINSMYIKPTAVAALKLGLKRMAITLSLPRELRGFLSRLLADFSRLNYHVHKQCMLLLSPQPTAVAVRIQSQIMSTSGVPLRRKSGCSCGPL